MEDELQTLSQSAALFEVSVPDCKQLKSCRKEIVLLKNLWDMIILVRRASFILRSEILISGLIITILIYFDWTRILKLGN